MLKNLLLAGGAAGSAGLFWWKVQPWLADPFAWDQTAVWAWPLALLILWVALSSLAFLLISFSYLKWAVVLWPLVAYGLWFGFQPLLLGGVLISGLWHLSAMRVIKKEQDNRLKFALAATMRGGIFRILTAIFILMALAYFFTPGVQNVAEKKELPPGITRTVQMIVGRYAEKQLPENNPRFVAQVNERVMSQLHDFLIPYFKYAPAVLALSLFLALQGLRLVFLWVTLLLASLIFLMLKLFKQVAIKKVSKEGNELVF